jgi:hypothetical protein
VKVCTDSNDLRRPKMRSTMPIVADSAGTKHPIFWLVFVFSRRMVIGTANLIGPLSFQWSYGSVAMVLSWQTSNLTVVSWCCHAGTKVLSWEFCDGITLSSLWCPSGI